MLQDEVQLTGDFILASAYSTSDHWVFSRISQSCSVKFVSKIQKVQKFSLPDIYWIKKGLFQDTVRYLIKISHHFFFAWFVGKPWVSRSILFPCSLLTILKRSALNFLNHGNGRDN